MAEPGPTGWFNPLIHYNWTMIQNIKRDPFEQAIGADVKSSAGLGGSLAAPMSAYMYDWNILPIGQMIALRHLESFVEFPPMQAPPSYNLDQVMAEIEAQRRAFHTAPHPSE